MNKNIQMIIEIAQGLQDLKNDVVFVGGAAASLYFQKFDENEIRPTEDVDCIIEISSKAKYFKLSEKLLNLKFSPDTTKNAPIC